MIFPSVVCVQHYFDKRRTLAMGISVAGSGIGTFALAPFQRWLADLVGWRHLMIVLAGVSFTGTFLGLLYKPLPKHKTDSSVEALGDLPDTDLGLEEKMPSKAVDMIVIKDTEYECNVFKTTMKYAQDFDDGTVKSKDDLNSKELQLNQSQIIENDTKERDINPKTTTGVNTTPSIDHSLQPENKGSFTTCFDKCRRDGPVGVIHWSLLKEPSFVVWLVCFFGCQFAVVVPLTFMPDSAMERNIGGPEAAFLISVIGIVNIAARPLIGFVADRNHVRHHRLKLLAAGAFIGGVALIVSPFCKTYATLVIVVILMGLSQGWVTDVTGSYDVTFYISGGVVITCSFAMATIKRCQKETIDAEVPCLANIPDLDAAIITTAGIL
ncbi:monocarboxylate transporter 12-like [Lingula anatina]|uniref:Monocarboxylate transporter 12-like n=1 Tax=Lingula anatina TaxID=7574 RepID=A0A2R2MJJ5_LINAN|nr:monocarboxylate transporter 12-like [Lingula anatina]|eukprot:XP_023930396.1 monocarboxylate transporter 12-like [Lingula anatina]